MYLNRHDGIRDKPALRERLKAVRAGLSAERRGTFSQRIRARVSELPEVRRAVTVFCFVSAADEVDTHMLIDILQDAGKRILVPRILPERRMIAVIFPGWLELEPGALGIPTPRAVIEFKGRIDVCITPGLGFSIAGARLGYGRGYYDRWFAAHDGGCRLALAFECQLVPDLPVNAGDMPVQLIATEERLIRIDRPVHPA
ncbi:MAG: 5-formyltetrahydrofolate cyclo-ligase [Gammaproteobacteria bacterium]